MRAVVTAVVAAIEAAAVALLGLLIVTLPPALLWAITFNLAAEPADVFSAAFGTWFLAHFVPLQINISAESAVGLGLAQQQLGFVLSLAPLGVTLVTAAFGGRSGWRAGQRGGSGGSAPLGGTLGFAAIAALVYPVAQPMLDWPAWSAILFPALVFGACALVGFLARAAREGHPWWAAFVQWIQRGIERARLSGAAALPTRAALAVRLAVAMVVGLLGLAALGVGVALIAGYVQVAGVSQSLQLDSLGALLLFLLQLALLPVCIIWGASWFTGAGFSVGTGTSVTPFETLLGPMPALPLFGAIPAGSGSGGGIAVALVVLVGVTAGALFGRSPRLRGETPFALGAILVSAAALAGLMSAGLGAAASGAIGPDRLASAGVQHWMFGGLAAAELGTGLVLGVLAARLDTAKLQRVWPQRGDVQDEQLTVPLDGYIAGISGVNEPLRYAVDLDDTRHTQHRIADDEASQHETQPLDGTAVEAGVRSWSSDADALIAAVIEPDTEAEDGSADQTLADSEPDAAEETDTDLDADRASGEGADPESDAERERTLPVDESLSLEDSLVQAYSWDELPDDEAGDAPGQEPDEHRGWRMPWRKR